MSFAQRRHYRFPVFRPVRYESGNCEGHGSVTNVSSIGWRLSGSLPVAVGDVCSLKVRLSSKQWVSVEAGTVRWVCGEEFGIETLAMNDTSQTRLSEYIQDRIKTL